MMQFEAKLTCMWYFCWNKPPWPKPISKPMGKALPNPVGLKWWWLSDIYFSWPIYFWSLYQYFLDENGTERYLRNFTVTMDDVYILSWCPSLTTSEVLVYWVLFCAFVCLDSCRCWARPGSVDRAGMFLCMAMQVLNALCMIMLTSTWRWMCC